MKYPIIIALDPPNNTLKPLNWALKIIDETKDLVIGYKIGLPLVLELGRELSLVLEKTRDSELVIADLKLADIGDIMLTTIKKLAQIGFNTYIVHSFIGLRNGLDKISDYLKKTKGKLVTILSMSHPGSNEVIDKNYDLLLDITLKANAWGCVVGATKPELIMKTRRITREKNADLKIISPGIGVQGAKPGSAIKAGADYEIIGRLITRDPRPREKLLEIINLYQGV